MKSCRHNARRSLQPFTAQVMKMRSKKPFAENRCVGAANVILRRGGCRWGTVGQLEFLDFGLRIWQFVRGRMDCSLSSRRFR